MKARRLRIATRGSALALAQTRQVAAALEGVGQDHELVIVTTAGDVRAPDTAWGEGAFVTAIEEVVVNGEADIAVHSAKDVPTREDPRLAIAAFLQRADARDAFVAGPGALGRTLTGLAPGSRVGTDSPRRVAFGSALRPDLVFQPLHGNVDTRLRRLDEGQVDALILAVAGLARLGLAARIDEPMDPEVMPPAPGQGAIAVQVRTDDADARAIVAAIDDPATRLSVVAERAFLRATGGGCRSPIGALAEVADDGRLHLFGALVDGATGAIIRGRGDTEAADPADAARLGEELAARLVARPRVLVTRAAGRADELEAALASNGLAPVHVPAIEIEMVASARRRAIADAVTHVRWVVLTSPNSVEALAASLDPGVLAGLTVRWAAVGPSTAAALGRLGIADAWTPSRADGLTLAGELPVVAGDRVLLLRGSLADSALPAQLTARGASVREVTTHRTVEGPSASGPALAAALAGGLAAVIFASGSAVRGTIALTAVDQLDGLRALPAVCIGSFTAAAAREAGFHDVLESPVADVEALAALARDGVTGSIGTAAR